MRCWLEKSRTTILIDALRPGVPEPGGSGYSSFPSPLLHHSRPKAHGSNQGLAFRRLEILTRRTFVLWVVDSLRTRPNPILCKNVSIGEANSIFRLDCRVTVSGLRASKSRFGN